jgi:hypothetical protein
MKKVCLFLMLSVFALGSSGFKTENRFGDPETNCDYLAMSEYFLVLGSGNSQELANDAFFDTYWDCIDDGGYSETTLNLN